MNDREQLEAARQRFAHDALSGAQGALKKLEEVERRLAQMNLEREREELAHREDELRSEQAAEDERERIFAEIEAESRELREKMRAHAPELDALIGDVNRGLLAWKGLVMAHYLAENKLGRAHGSDYQYVMAAMSWPVRIALEWLEGVDPAPHTAPSTFEALAG